MDETCFSSLMRNVAFKAFKHTQTFEYNNNNFKKSILFVFYLIMVETGTGGPLSLSS